MTKPKIFISYSHKDEKIKNDLVTHLYALKASDKVEIFDTMSISPGQEWSSTIQKEIAEADIILLLISSDFLASDYIINQELPAILKRHEEKGQVVIPVIARPALWTNAPELRKLQVWPRDARPLSGLSILELDNELADLSKRISDIVDVIKKDDASLNKIEKVNPQLETAKNGVHFFVSHDHADGDFAELLKLKLEKEGLSAWIDIERLPVGEDWRLEIDNAIKTAAALIVIMSPDARQSEYVTYEWAFAWGHGTSVIPILLKETSMHPRLSSLQYLDFTNRIARPWDKLIDAMRKSISKS